jgi:predicted metal-dependent peptidase
MPVALAGNHMPKRIKRLMSGSMKRRTLKWHLLLATTV